MLFILFVFGVFILAGIYGIFAAFMDCRAEDKARAEQIWREERGIGRYGGEGWVTWEKRQKYLKELEEEKNK